MIIYGLSTCALCQKAQKALEETGREITFRDIRADPLNDTELDRLVLEFGDRLVDRTTPDYRALSDWLKASEPEAQIAAKPKVMARPVIEDEDKFYLGWDEKVRKVLLKE